MQAEDAGVGGVVHTWAKKHRNKKLEIQKYIQHKTLVLRALFVKSGRCCPPLRRNNYKGKKKVVIILRLRRY